MDNEKDINAELNVDIDPAEQARLNQHLFIMKDTPLGQDPLTYWYHCAHDALDTITKKDQQHKDQLAEHDAELKDLRLFKYNEQHRKDRDAFARSTPPVRELLDRVQHGDFSMTVTFSFFPNDTRSNGGATYDQEE